MTPYLHKISKASQVAAVQMKMKSEQGKLIYPKQIKREPGAKLLYDVMCLDAVKVFFGFNPYEKNSDNMIAEDWENSELRCEQIAETALNLEKVIKELSDQELKDADIVKNELRKCFEGMNEIIAMVQGQYLNSLAEKIMELIKNVYL